MKLNRAESELVGSWSMKDGHMFADAVAKRIEELIGQHLIELGADDSGWDMLYRDPDDGRLWELTHPQGDSHGGGPPTLRCVDAVYARRKYSQLDLTA
jgi:hypothetical protein